MRKEYGGIFRSKYYWEYVPTDEKDDQELVRKRDKITARRWYVNCFSFPKNIKEQEKLFKDKLEWFASLIYNDQVKVLESMFILFPLRKLEIYHALNSNQFFTNQEQSLKSFIYKPTGDHKMKIEIAGYDEVVKVLCFEKIGRDRDCACVMTKCGDHLVNFAPDGTIYINKRTAKNHGFKIEVID